MVGRHIYYNNLEIRRVREESGSGEAEKSHQPKGVSTGWKGKTKVKFEMLVGSQQKTV